MTDLYQLKRTPFHERISVLCLPQNWRRWAGHIAPGRTTLGSSASTGRSATRGAHRRVAADEVRDRGPDAARLLDRLTRATSPSSPSAQVYYTGWCDEEGKLLDDGTVTRLGEQSFRLTRPSPRCAGCT